MNLEPNELRIGNLVYWNIPEKVGVPHVIKAILPNTYHTSPISVGKHEDYLPIPLTKERLLKFGFEKCSDNEHYFIGHHGFCLIYDGDDWCMEPRIDDSLLIAYCKYVHQLQNLYFALTGQELTFKETLNG